MGTGSTFKKKNENNQIENINYQIRIEKKDKF